MYPYVFRSRHQLTLDDIAALQFLYGPSHLEHGSLLHLVGTTGSGRLWHSIRFASGEWTALSAIEHEAGNHPGMFHLTDIQSVNGEI